MEGLKTASNAIKKATDELVKSAQESIQEEPAAQVVKVDIFKEVYFHYFYSPYF